MRIAQGSLQPVENYLPVNPCQRSVEVDFSEIDQHLRSVNFQCSKQNILSSQDVSFNVAGQQDKVYLCGLIWRDRSSIVAD